MGNQKRLTDSEIGELSEAVRMAVRSVGTMGEIAQRERTAEVWSKYGERVLAELQERRAEDAARSPDADIDAKTALARKDVLERLLKAYNESPTAWFAWDKSEPDFDAKDRAARDLEEEGLIKARFTSDRSDFTAQITKAGREHWKAGRR